MRKNCILIFATLLSSSLLARQAATSPAPATATPASSAVVTNATTGTVSDAGTTNAAPSKKKAPAKRKAGKKPATTKKENGAELKTVPLIPGPAVVDATHVNVRGQAKLNSEVVTRLTKGQKVTVLEEITHNNSGPDEPSAWAKIALPTDVHVWINTRFIDAANKTVKPKKLNVRGGPGENFSVLGRLERGEPVNQVSTKGDWTEIEAPTNAYAFVAAQYLKQEPATSAPIEPVASTSTVTNDTTLAAAPTEAPTNALAVAANTTGSTTSSVASVTDTGTDNSSPKADEPPPRRVVAREGLVRGTTSIQAPTHFELISPDNHRTIDYLYTSSPNLDLSRYKGLRIIVTGEEGLEERWGNTPVITIEKIQVVE